jgi:hypothetical protein
MKKQNLLFDEGGVLVFPDFDRLLGIAQKSGLQISKPHIIRFF